MGGGNLANQSRKKGFAISGILYPLLILTLFLVVQMLFMLQTRKNVLDKARTELADTVNASNKVYNNEELSILIDEMNSKFLDKTYPIGSIYISYNNTNPGSLFGGTWVSYGAGRTLVGMDTTQTEFNTIGKTGGEKSHILTVNEMPSHNHQTIKDGYSVQLFYVPGVDITENNYAMWYGSNGAVTGTTGSSQAHNNLQPYITVYMFRRTA